MKNRPGQLQFIVIEDREVTYETASFDEAVKFVIGRKKWMLCQVLYDASKQSHHQNRITASGSRKK